MGAQRDSRDRGGELVRDQRHERVVPSGPATADDAAAYTRTEDVIYGRKYGTALTMDVFTPEAGRQRRWASSSSSAAAGSRRTRRSTPGFVDAAARARLHRLRRRPRQPAEVHHPRGPRGHEPGRPVHPLPRQGYGIDPDRHRHLRRLGGRPPVADAGDRRRRRATRRPRTRSTGRPAGCRRWPASSRRPTSSTTASRARTPSADGILEDFTAPFDFHELDPKTERRSSRSTDEDEIARDRPADLADQPRQRRRPADPDHPRRRRQAGADPAGRDRSSTKLKEAGRRRPKLVVKPGAGHGWADMAKDIDQLADWFDKHLKKRQ